MIKYLINIKKISNMIFICLIASFFLISCQWESTAPEIGFDDNENEVNDTIGIYSYIMIKGNHNIIKDCTPEFIIFTERENACFMSFSGDGNEWSEWIDYSRNYENFNIANGFNGTTIESGTKTIYIRFQDNEGDIFPKESHDPIYCSFEYEIQELFSIRIEPYEVEVSLGGSKEFTLRGYDVFMNEVPLDVNKIYWTKGCGAGELIPSVGMKTTYFSPKMPGVRNITAHYGSLSTGAIIYIK
jgi:hypothetical protein